MTQDQLAAAEDLCVRLAIEAGRLQDAWQAAWVQRNEARGLLDQAAVYLATTHRHAGRHDLLGADLACAGCALLDRIEAALAASEPAQDARDALCARRGAPNSAPASPGPRTHPEASQGRSESSSPTDTEGAIR